ncbi:MAG: aspartate 1-decarboxylase [Chromatiales bacterium]|nr:aspartate 1-decarboxylase [Chromatiales bacterium]
MELTFLQSKLHRACVTGTEVNYDGSCAIDSDLMAAAGIREYQQIEIYNLRNGDRLTTYAISAAADSQTIELNGAAAYRGIVGDRIIICTYVQLCEAEAKKHKPTLVYLDKHNRIVKINSASMRPQLSALAD